MLLDEVGETSARMQAMLLRFLDSGEVQRIGGHSTTCVDVRLIAATNRDLAKSVVAKEFRLDLFYRLNVLHLQTTALHERREDISAGPDRRSPLLMSRERSSRQLSAAPPKRPHASRKLMIDGRPISFTG